MKPRRCKKHRYRTAVDAMIALANIQARDNPRRPKMEKRYYPCPFCHGFHLTSKEARNTPSTAA